LRAEVAIPTTATAFRSFTTAARRGAAIALSSTDFTVPPKTGCLMIAARTMPALQIDAEFRRAVDLVQDVQPRSRRPMNLPVGRERRLRSSLIADASTASSPKRNVRPVACVTSSLQRNQMQERSSAPQPRRSSARARSGLLDDLTLLWMARRLWRASVDFSRSTLATRIPACERGAFNSARICGSAVATISARP
jgi:hypothetical protein